MHAWRPHCWFEVCRTVSQAGGSAKLEALLAHVAEEATPEFLRQRPKYYYYNLWMRERIAEHCGGELPEPVVLKMLDMDAGELDLILKYPTAAKQQASFAVMMLMPSGRGPICAVAAHHSLLRRDPHPAHSTRKGLLTA